MKTLAIIGGGAGGMMCAIWAKRLNKNLRVVLLERLPRVGKKLMATGNGRCNITNKDINLSHYHGGEPSFAKFALEAFNLNKTIEFFESIGVSIFFEDGKKAYPKSLQASSVVDCLRWEMARLNIEEITDYRVNKTEKNKNGFKISGENVPPVYCDYLVVAAGGMASPALGSSGDLFPLLEKMGHTKTALFPALVQLKLDADKVRAIKGIKTDAIASVVTKNGQLQHDFGEILFTEYGISGPPILNLSRCANACLLKGEKPCISLNLLPEFSEKELFSYLLARKNALAGKTIDEFLCGFINKKLGQTILKACNILPFAREVKTLTKSELALLSKTLLAWQFEIKGSMPFKNAQVCAGGIKTSKVCPRTMESKIINNLYLIGEILDIDGDCGGYNLQWAWSSAYVAACHIASKTN